MTRALLALLMLCTACATNPYAKFYRGLPDARVRPDYDARPEPLQVYSTSDFNRDALELFRRGYGLIGESSFNAGTNSVKESQIRAQAAHVGAQVVLVSSRYTNTVNGAIPLSLPRTTTTTTTATATATGSSRYATAYGTGTSVASGTQTVMIPYSVRRADFAAMYFAHLRGRLGLVVIPLDDSTRARIQSNAGVRVLVMVDGSPAFDADVLPGDLVLRIGEDKVDSVERFGQLLVKYDGKTAELVINRDGHEIHKSVTLLTLRKL